MIALWSVDKWLNPIELPRRLRTRFAQEQRPGKQEMDSDQKKERKRFRIWRRSESSETHPRILLLYHKMAPTTSKASSSRRRTGTTMDVLPETEKHKIIRGNHNCFLSRNYGLEWCDLLLETGNSTGAAISHWYPVHSLGQLHRKRTSESLS